MKTPAQWTLDAPMGSIITEDDARAIQDDARAGMVPEGELAEAKAEGLEHWNAFCDSEQRRVDAEAELAKAWEAGRTAAAEFAADWYGDGHQNSHLVRGIRALQPPGGKAK